MSKHILLVYIEPTPYILDLLNLIVLNSNKKIDVLFLGKNISQSWNIDLDKRWIVLPNASKDKIRILFLHVFHKKYALIHIAGWGNPWMILLILLAKIKNMPLSVETDTPLPYKIKWWKKWVKRLLYPRLFSWVDLFLPGGTRQAKYLEYYGVKPKDIIPVQMTVDVANIMKNAEKLLPHDKQNIRNRYNLSESSVVFLFVGRLVVHKGVGDLIAVFNQLTIENAILLFVGDGPMRQQVEDATHSNKNIIYAGRIAGKDLIEIYHAADVLVLPSHAEPWGLVINEAMAVGLPVIVSDRVGCVDDLVSHQNTGLIVEAECINDLQRAIVDLYGSAEKRAKMSSQATKTIENWTLENEAKKMNDAWSKLICV